MRWLVMIVCGLWATGCATTMVLDSEQHPEDARLRLAVTCQTDDTEIRAEVHIENPSDEAVVVAPAAFQMRDAADEPLTFASWDYFGGSADTSNRPRPLYARATMHGVVRFALDAPTDRVHLTVTLDGETHAFLFKSPE